MGERVYNKGVGGGSIKVKVLRKFLVASAEQSDIDYIQYKERLKSRNTDYKQIISR